MRLYDEASEGGITNDPPDFEEQLSAALPDDVSDAPAPEQPEPEAVADDGLDTGDIELPDVPEGSLLHRFREEFGVDLSNTYADDDKLIASIPEILKHNGRQANELGELRKQLQQYEAYVQQVQQQQPVQQQPQQPVQQNGVQQWTPPRWDKSWDQFVIKTDDGAKDLAPHTPIEVRQKIAELAQWQELVQNDPRAAFSPMMAEIEHRAQQAAMQRMAEMVQQAIQHQQVNSVAQADQQQAVAIFEQTKDQLCVKNAAGEVMYDPQTSLPLLNPAGHRYRQLAEEFYHAITNETGRPPSSATIHKHIWPIVKSEFAKRPRQTPPVSRLPQNGSSYSPNRIADEQSLEQALVAALSQN